jgi:hypothetical protein
MHALTTLNYANKTLLDSLKGLTDTDWDTPGVCGFWSVKQIIAHISAWDAHSCETLAPYAGVTAPTPYSDDFATFNFNDDLFNEKYGTAAASKSKQELLAELEAVYLRLSDVCSKISNEDWHKTGVLSWAPANDFEDYLIYAVYGHHYEHAAQIIVFRDSRVHHKG